MTARTPLPTSLAVAYYGALGFSVVLGCCATYNGASVVIQRVAMRDAERELHDGETLPRQLVELDPILLGISTGDVIFDLVTVIALGFAGGLGLAGRTAARGAGLIGFGLLALGVLVDAGTTVWMWSLITHWRGAGPNDGVMQAAMAVGMIPSAIWMLIRLAFAGVAVRGVLSAEATAYYARIASQRPPVRE